MVRPLQDDGAGIREGRGGDRAQGGLVKLNVDEEPAVAGRFNVRSIPTLVLALHGRELARSAGARSAAQLVQWVEQELRRANVTSS